MNALLDFFKRAPKEVEPNYLRIVTASGGKLVIYCPRCYPTAPETARLYVMGVCGSHTPPKGQEGGTDG